MTLAPERPTAAEPVDLARSSDPRAAPDPAAAEAIQRTWQDPPGLAGWLMTVQNGPIAKRFLFTTFAFFLVGGVQALMIRTQLIQPNNTFLGPQAYNEMFTMHGTTMMFLFAVPIMEAFANFLLPLMLGTRELPYPRMTAFGYWSFLMGGLFFYSSYLFQAVPDGGWFAYVPLTGPEYSPGLKIDFWLLGLSVAEIAAMGASIELIVSVLKTRAPGMSINRMPLFAWAILAMGFAIIFGFTPLLVGTTFLELDRKIGTHFYNPEGGGQPLLWQHLFWIFGHPEVYIQFLPATGIVSMIVPTFARRPVVGYSLIVVAIIGTAFVSFGLWVHHMFTTGIPLLALAFFAAASFSIAIASGIQIFAWIATLWSGRPVFRTPLLFVLGFMFIFVLGGITGVMVATVPFDWQVHDSYFVVAHFHYVLIGGVVFPIFGALYYWLPKIAGRALNETLGKWNFWFLFVGFNVTFFPMHITGLLGMPRRYYTYEAHLGWNTLNFISTIGAYILAVGVLLFLWNVVHSLVLKGSPPADPDPWRAGTLDFATTTPPPDSGYVQIPTLRSRYPLWEQRDLGAASDPRVARVVDGLTRSPTTWRASLVTSAVNAEIEAISPMSTPSWWPFLLASALTVLFAALLFDIYPFIFVGLVATIACTIAWLWPSPSERNPEGVDEHGLLHGVPVFVSGQKSLGWWGMLLTLVIFAVMFATMAFSYYYLQATSVEWPPPGIDLPGLFWPAVNSVVLVASAVPAFWAERSIRRGDQGGLVIGLAGQFLLGGLFVALQFYDFSHLGFTPQTNVFGSLFFTIAVTHLVLALTGLLISAVTQVQAWLGYFTALRFVAVQNTALYWYFVVGTWFLVLWLVYLSPRII